MNKILLLLFAFILGIYHAASGQVLHLARYSNHTFTNASPTIASDITSDFGMRNPGTRGTLFHRGVDFNPEGDDDLVILAPFDGNIVKIRRNGITDLIIESTATPAIRLDMLHIFNDDRFPITYNGFELLEKNNRLVIIDLVNCRAFSADTTPLTVQCNGQNITTTNTFQANWPLAPVGTSGGYAYHLHLMQLENGNSNYNDKDDCIDAGHDIRTSTNYVPLGTRLRRRDFSPAINIRCNNNCEQTNSFGIWNNFVPTYTDNTRNIIQTEVSISNATAPPSPIPNTVITDRYSNGFMNESLIEVKIKNKNSGAFGLIEGSRTQSRFRVDPRGTEVTYPDNLRNGVYGNLTETGAGCAPYAYTSDIGFQPYDYYITPDFYLRIRKDHAIGTAVKLANYPWESRYTDGDYEIKSTVTDIDNRVTELNPAIDFSIDNFQPLVKEVSVRFPDKNIDLYYNRWNPIAGTGIAASSLKIGTRAEGALKSLIGNGNLVIYAVMSEKMDWVKAKITGPGVSTPEISGSVVSYNNDGTEKWQFLYLGSILNFAFNGCYKITFTGQDMNTNHVLDFQIPEPQLCNWGITKIVQVPKRTGPGSWDVTVPTGKDEVHRFRILECQNCRPESTDEAEQLTACLQAEQVAVAVTNADFGQQNGGIALTIQGFSPCMKVAWRKANDYNTVISTSTTLTGLAPGEYCYTIIHECCTLSACITVGENCPVITVNANPLITLPSACNASDGQIRFLSISASGGTSPYSYTYQDEDGNLLEPVPGTSTLSNLPPGRYFVVVTDAKGCTGRRMTELIPADFPEVQATIQPSCSNVPVGSVTLEANAVSGNTMDFSWDNGIEHTDVLSSQIIQLEPGNYCVTITTHGTDCLTERCYQVPVSNPNGTLDAVKADIHPCPSLSNGSVSLTVTGGTTPYRFDWSDLNDFTEPEDRTNLPAGLYKVTVYDYCNNTKEFTSNLRSLGIEFNNVQIACDGKAAITATAFGGNPPYSFTWSNGKTTASVSDLGVGNYCVTVRDQIGCIKSGCYQVKKKSVVEEETKPSCAGMSDGSALFTVYNADGSFVTATLLGVPVTIPNPRAAEINLSLTNLSAGTYTLEVKTGNCPVVAKTFTIKTQPTHLVFNHLVNNECIYDTYCKDSFLVSGSTRSNLKISYQYGHGGLFKCNAPAYCGTTYVKDVDFDQRTVTASEYRAVLNAAATSGAYNSEYINSQMDKARKWGDCHHVRYCTANLQATSSYNSLKPGQTFCSGNCCVVECALWRTHFYCLNDILPDHIPVQFVEECRVRTYKVIQLLRWFNDINNDFPDIFHESSLEKFLIQNQNRPEAACASVSFCLSDFRILHTNIDYVDCSLPIGSPLPPDGNKPCDWGFLEGTNNLISFCRQPNCPDIVCIIPNISNIQYNHLDNAQPKPGNNQTYVDTRFQGTVKDFTYTVQDDSRQPSLILDSPFGRKHYMYSPYALIMDTDSANYMEYMIDDWSSNAIALVEKFDDRHYGLRYSSGQREYTKFLSSNDYLSVTRFDYKNGKAILAGYFKGALDYADNHLGHAAETSGFVLVLDDSVGISGFSVLQNIKTDIPLTLDHTNDKWSISCVAKSNWVGINNEIHENILTGNAFNLAVNQHVYVRILNNVLNNYSAQTMKKTVYSKVNNTQGILLTGFASTGSSTPLNQTPGTKVVTVLTQNNAGTILWSHSLQLDSTSLSRPDLVSDGHGGYWLSLNFVGHLTLADISLQSKGKHDILVVHYDSTGQIKTYKQYGTSDDEVIRKIHCDSDVLYLAGEYDGPSPSRQIGKDTFVNIAGIGEAGKYLVWMSCLLPDTTQQYAYRPATDRTAPDTILDFTIQPNPFNTELIISVESSRTNCLMDITIFDATGKTCWRQVGLKETSTTTIPVHQWPVGTYWVRVRDHSGRAHTKKVVKQ